MELSGKVILVTGGSRGIGRSIVYRCAEEGAVVYFTYLGSQAKAEEIVKDLQSKGFDAHALQADASDFQRAQEVVEGIIKNHQKIDVLINNAGIAQDNLLLRLTEEQWDTVINNNLKSAFNYCKAVIKPMLKQRDGVIINMGSVVGISGNAGQANYSASKAGLIGLSKSIAKELGSRNIRCNVVAPGFIRTEMTEGLPEQELQKWLADIPLNRPGQVEDIANICVFLASNKASYITGQVIQVDGGMNM
ncbi:MAG: beta-ketoacyl-ACP reductase [Bacteroidia bacterium]|nr:MAG: beta-ketoacyl-ACP reductase [Bacteroidia bacterium]